MKLLLDTNVFLWASREPQLLSGAARTLLTDPYNERYVSIATLWEMQIKHSIGKLELPGNADEISQAWLRPLGAQLLPIEVRHVGKLYDLPFLHRDPFDRILVAQALSDGMSIVTADAAFGLYKSAQVLW